MRQFKPFDSDLAVLNTGRSGFDWVLDEAFERIMLKGGAGSSSIPVVEAYHFPRKVAQLFYETTHSAIATITHNILP